MDPVDLVDAAPGEISGVSASLAQGRTGWLRRGDEPSSVAARADPRPEPRYAVTLKTTIIVQSFVIKRKRLVPGDREVAATESGARKKAAALAGRHPGAAVIAVRADDETGEVETVTVVERFGEIPDDFEERLLG